MIQPQLADPAADMEGEGKADQDGYDVQIQFIVRSKPPWQQSKGKERDAIWSDGYRKIAEPSAAVGYMAVLVIDFEPVDFPEKKQGEHQMGEFVIEFHHPPGVLTYARDQEKEEERGETDGQSLVKMNPGDVFLECLHQYTHRHNEKGRQYNAVQNITCLFQKTLETSDLRHA